MTIAAGLALAMQLLQGIRNAAAAGRTEISEGDIDRAVAELDANDAKISDALERKRKRDAGEA